MASPERSAARQAVALEREIRELESLLRRVTAGRRAAGLTADRTTEQRLAKRRRTLARTRTRLAETMAATTPQALTEARRRDEARRDARRPAPSALRGVIVAPGTAGDATHDKPRQPARRVPSPGVARPQRTTRTATASQAVKDEPTTPNYGHAQLLTDPDSATRTVWIFKTGSSFHRRDCRLVENRGNAVQVPVQRAKDRGMTRCMHCCPSVR